MKNVSFTVVGFAIHWNPFNFQCFSLRLLQCVCDCCLFFFCWFSNRITEMQCCALVPYIKYIRFSFALKFISFDNYIRCNVRKIECWNNASNQVNYFQTGTINWNWPINSDVRFNRKWIIIFTLFIFVRVVVANKFILFFFLSSIGQALSLIIFTPVF